MSTERNEKLSPRDGVAPKSKPKPGALVEDETLVGTTDGGVRTKAPDGKVDEGATDRRENR